MFRPSEASVRIQGWKKPRFLEKKFLGFNVHNAEHRYMTNDNSLHENICLLMHCFYSVPNLKVIDG